jgi:hypothetical protein
MAVITAQNCHRGPRFVRLDYKSIASRPLAASRQRKEDEHPDRCSLPEISNPHPPSISPSSHPTASPPPPAPRYCYYSTTHLLSLSASSQTKKPPTPSIPAVKSRDLAPIRGRYCISLLGIPSIWCADPANFATSRSTGELLLGFQFRFFSLRGAAGFP